MERRRVEVSPVRPHERVNLRVQPHLCEDVGILKRAIQLAGKHRCEIDGLLRTVPELHAERVRADAVERSDLMERMRTHRAYCNGAIGRGGRPACRRSQSALSSPW